MANPSDTRAYIEWITHMKAGSFEQAWLISDRLVASSPAGSTQHLPRHLQRVWNGDALLGKRVLVRCNHGLGDTLQFARYLPMVKHVADWLEIEAQPELRNLLESLGCIDYIFDIDAAHRAVFDVEIEVMELQHAFRTSLSTIPREVPYFHVNRPPIRGGSAMHVGLVWRAGDWDDRRSIPFPELHSLFDVPYVQFHILQRDPEAAGWLEGYGSLSCGPTLDDDAAKIASLDLMISVDTMTAHLAGALGTRVWTLLHSDADWRWLEDREDSPWYPTMRLFRQGRAGDWQSVMEVVKRELASKVTDVNRIQISRQDV